MRFRSPHASDLSFDADERLRITGPSPDDSEWCIGESMDGKRRGGFPKVRRGGRTLIAHDVARWS